jgi:hypothetical protein
MKAARASLATPAKAIAGGLVIETPTVAGETEAPKPTQGLPVKKPQDYHKVSIYLSEAEVRALKLLAVDTGLKVSEIGAVAIRKWMADNGHGL